MKPPNQPAEIAREAIRRLTAHKLPPTPDNYRRAYDEVAGLPSETRIWAQAIRDLIREWDASQSGLTSAMKREMLERELLNFGTDATDLCQRMSRLAHAWAEAQDANAGATPGAEAGALAGTASGIGGESTAPILFRFQQSLDNLAEALAGNWPDLAQRCHRLRVHPHLSPARLLDEVDGLLREILLRAEDDHDLLRGMRRLVALLFENLVTLVGEDAWLRGQLASMQAILSGQINYHALFEAERGLQEIVAKQGKVKDHLLAAKGKLKQLITAFIDRVGEMSSSTGTYQERLAQYSQRIAEAEDIDALADVVDRLSADMGDVRLVMQRSHEELVEARNHVVQAEARIVALEKELDQISNLVREDQLTGALNRRGLEETFTREAARAKRLHAPLSLALLDIDHFKRLNDSLGHQAGDRALIHLAGVVRQLLRPSDSLARWGGEEFLILLPNTSLDEAVEVLRRLQRELTRKIFLHELHKILITFSAGVVQWRPDEAREALIGRADAAMYRAKATGRNRVEADA